MKNNNLIAKYNMSVIMKRAWKLLNDNSFKTFSECLVHSWKIAKNGADGISFTQIYNKYYKQILYFVNSRVNNITDSEDITATIFIKFHKNFDKYDVYQAKVSTYLHVIAKNIIIDFFRTSKKDNYVNVDSFVDESGNELFQFVDDSNNDNIENTELHNSISNALNTLKPNYKEIAELYFIKELKYNEIADILNIPIGSVKGNIARARKMLQNNLMNIRIKNSCV